MTRHFTETPQFFLTAPSTCPYIEGREERKIFTHLVGENAAALNDLLTHGGFRRSQNIAYRPACEGCRACVSVRVRVSDFVWERKFRKIMKRNTDLIGIERPAQGEDEHYALFRDYLESRHADGGMADMSFYDYMQMVEDSHVDTMLIEYRARDIDSGISGDSEGPLFATALTDRLVDGLSMVYSFYTPSEHHRSLGTYMILEHIDRTHRLGLPYLYLGYWVEGSQKMDYKARFLPQERLGMEGWTLVTK
ncbi:arginyltransferase [Coralliovum pocilloporae]|uniref:arginyltransferase n=1 Tax=Coralliovum pocilloporae TaxID=3066369 RepID=UPI003306F37F